MLTSGVPWVPGRMTNFALIGSFWIARSMAARANVSSTPPSSKRMRPGLTTATQNSGLPLPEPMRVSAGFWVTGLSGNTRIQTLPPRLTWRVMAIRAASIWRAVIQAGSRAWIPKSPKVTSLPPLAWPVIRPRCCLRCLTLRGISMSVHLLAEVRGLMVLARLALDLLVLGEDALELVRDGRRGGDVGRVVIGEIRGDLGLGGVGIDGDHTARFTLAGQAATAAGGDQSTGRGLATLTRGLTDGHGRLAGDLLLGGDLVGEDVALVDPDLHPDAPVGGLRLAEAVVDVGPQRVQRYPALAVGLLARHLRATQATGALDTDTEGAGRLHGLDRALHGTTERHPAGQLVADTLCDQGGVELGLLDLLDVELDPVVEPGDLLDLLLQPVGLRTAATDDDARPCRMDVHPQAVSGALDLDAADRRRLELRHQIVTDLPVLDHAVLVIALLEPARLPVGRDAESEPVGIYLLAHLLSPSLRRCHRMSRRRCRRMSRRSARPCPRRPRCPSCRPDRTPRAGRPRSR